MATEIARHLLPGTQLSIVHRPAMLRRTFLIAAVVAITDAAQAAAHHRFAFKIKTKSGGIVGNVVIEATDVEAAETKLMGRYPGCSILSVTEK